MSARALSNPSTESVFVGKDAVPVPVEVVRPMETLPTETRGL